jgi:hypothetical protein
MYASSASVTRAEFQGFYKESEVDPAPALWDSNNSGSDIMGVKTNIYMGNRVLVFAFSRTVIWNCQLIIMESSSICEKQVVKFVG